MDIRQQAKQLINEVRVNIKESDRINQEFEQLIPVSKKACDDYDRANNNIDWDSIATWSELEKANVTMNKYSKRLDKLEEFSQDLMAEKRNLKHKTRDLNNRIDEFLESGEHLGGGYDWCEENLTQGEFNLLCGIPEDEDVLEDLK